MFDRFSWKVALKQLRYNKAQTFLTVCLVAVSVTLIIFLSSLIYGLQKRLISSVTGSIPHITVTPEKRESIALWENKLPNDKTIYIGTRVAIEQKKRKIEDWAIVIPFLEDFDSAITAVSPTVDGQGFLIRGETRKAVVINGIIPEKHNRIVDIEEKLVDGRFFGLNAGEIALGYQIADDLDLKLGDKVRLISSEEISSTYTVAGIFDTGFRAVDTGTVYIPLRDAESLFGIGRAVTSIGIKITDIFEADNMAERLSKQIKYETNSWMKDNQSLLSGLRAQSQSSTLILTFTTIAAGFGIASILITLVVSKYRDIGILKAMGATNKQILSIFMLESTLLASLGSVVGAVCGIAFSLFVNSMRQQASATGRQAEVFPIEIRWQTVLGAMAIAVLIALIASLYPARRAAKVNPIDVIRGI
ncbi:MAG: ABC transporter permease [Armatimonadota bacterium]